ncbi:MAG: hypothetical protein NTU41_12610 [Chloroflexi bacterium]|nr:hypothetical protein [Chloroflexota bacterium]
MSEQLGKVERPFAAEYQEQRKLFFVPLVFMPKESQEDLFQLVNRYWDQVDAHIRNLETKLGQVARVYHELVTESGAEGVKAMDTLNSGSSWLAKSRLEKGANLHSIEEAEMLAEIADWSRCLAVGLQSQKAFDQVLGFHTEVQKKRYELIARRLDETLGKGESGILIMREGHGVQFAADIQVFYVSPPALDELRRWLRSRPPEKDPGEEPKAPGEGGMGEGKP